MSEYLLIESRDPYSTSRAASQPRLARDLRQAGHDVSLILVQNSVLAVRAEPGSAELQAAVSAGVEVLAEEFALRERGIPTVTLMAGIRATPIAVISERLALGWKSIWR
jgi:sulfur relay (sulfurtransferase) complex TusBCD TusD component (DsrE family)